ncbi:aldo/keto reductase [Microbacterium alcoholitolerans]|uniref:aldo/keto reductase n=1 Tax=unclassified Microbacterium TaxID=2609290 RepID=UPI003D179A0B
MSEMPSFAAHNGFRLPAVGLGTYRLNGDAGAAAVAAGLDLGYRLVDTAFNYENEGAVGAGIRASAIDRSEIIVATKLPGRHHAAAKARDSIEESRHRLGVDATDLHLIHWPNPSVGQYGEAWQALVDAQQRGTVRHVGVSNFLPEHLDRIESASGVRPVANQIEVHPYFPQQEALDLHAERGILTVAWSPLGRARELLQEPVIVEVAAGHGITPAQTVIAWHVARGTVSIPKASSIEHQQLNLDAASVVLASDEVEAITGLGRADGRLFDGDPATHEEM